MTTSYRPCIKLIEFIIDCSFGWWLVADADFNTRNVNWSCRTRKVQVLHWSTTYLVKLSRSLLYYLFTYCEYTTQIMQRLTYTSAYSLTPTNIRTQTYPYKHIQKNKYANPRDWWSIHESFSVFSERLVMIPALINTPSVPGYKTQLLFLIVPRYKTQPQSSCSEYLYLHALQCSRTTFILLASIIGHKHTKQTNKQLRTIHQSKINFKITL
jgi:hypothetical protein